MILDLYRIAEAIRASHPDVELEVREAERRIIFKVDAGKLYNFIRFLKDEAGRDFLSTLTAVDYQDRMEVVYFLGSYSDGYIFIVKTDVDRENPEVESVVDLFPTANFHEREVYDMFGVRFRNHPNLKRLLLPDDFEGHPLRKDYEWW